MGVFRRNHRTVGSPLTHGFQPFGAGVLRHVHVRVPLPLRTLIVHRALHQVLVLALQQQVGLIEVVTVAGFVSKRPEGDAGIVLVALEHVLRAIQVRLQPLDVVAQRSSLAQVVVHSVRLDVRLVIDIDTELIAQLVEAAVLRIVAKADRIDVVLLHQFKVLAHQLFRHVVSRHLVMLVDIHTFQFQGLAVNQQHHVGLSVLRLLGYLLDFNPAEADVVRNHFRYLLPLFQCYQQLIQVRVLGSPGLHCGQVRAERHRLHIRSLHRTAFRRGSYSLSRCLVYQFILHLHGLVGRQMIAHVHRQFEDTVLVAVVQRRDHPEILHRRLGLGIDEHVTLDAAHAPKVLALQIGACAPAENLQHQRIAAILQILVYQVFGRVLGIFVVAHFLTVQIDVNAGLGTCDVQIDVTIRPVCRHRYLPAVNAHRNIIGQLRRLRIERLELVTVIGIDRDAISLHLPVSRYLNVVPVLQLSRRLNRIRRQTAVRIGIIELPSAVEQLVILTALILSAQCSLTGVIRHKSGTRGFSVHRDGLYVLPIRHSVLTPIGRCCKQHA